MLSWATVNAGCLLNLLVRRVAMQGDGVTMAEGLALHQALDVGAMCPLAS